MHLYFVLCTNALRKIFALPKLEIYKISKHVYVYKWKKKNIHITGAFKAWSQ